MKRMLVNATQQEELRVALVDGQKLFDLSIELTSREQKKANVYKGKISRVEPSLEACFVDYGAQRHGFLPLKEVSRDYFRSQPQGGRMNIRELLQEGQELMVQVEKEERGTKGAALTTFISLAGRFLVLMPNNPRAGGVSRRIEGEDRDQMREVMGQLQIPDGMGAIVRTAGVGRSAEELQWDLDNLRTQWDQIEAGAKDRAAPFLVYRESDAVTRAMRDYLGDDVGEVLVDEPAAYQKAQEYMQRFFPNEAQRRLKMYNDDIALFTRFQIESQIESAYAHKVQLPSGGSIVVDYTEALVSIDINSARATRGSDIETTATNTNLEAADEIARQLRIRDIGGLIVIDFIDMESSKNQRDVEDRLRDAMKADRARIQIGRLSRFGLLEMSRQRLRPSLSDSSHIVCPRCVGIGSIRGVESMALAILRLIGEELRKDRTSRVIAQVPVEVATYLINEKREWLRTLEDKSSAELIIVPNVNMQTPDYTLRRVRDDETELPENRQTSYLMPTAAVVLEPGSAQDKKPQQEVPAVATILPSTSAPIIAHEPVLQAPPAPAPQIGVLGRLKRWLVGDSQPAAAAPAVEAPATSTGGHSRRERSDRTDRSHRRDRDGRRPSGGDRSHRHAEGAPRREREAGSETRERDGAQRGGEGHRDRDRGRARSGSGGERHEGRSGGEQRPRDGEHRASESRAPRDSEHRGGERGEQRSERSERGGRSRGAGGGGREGGREAGGPDRHREREAHAPKPVEETTLAAAAVSAEATGDVAGGPAPDSNGAPGAEGAGNGERGAQGERTGRGRRGRRRGRRGGGGGREGGGRVPGGQEGLFEGGGEGAHGGGEVDGNRAAGHEGEPDGNRAPRRNDVDGNRAPGYSNGSDRHHGHESHGSRESYGSRESQGSHESAGSRESQGSQESQGSREAPQRDFAPRESGSQENGSRESQSRDFGNREPAPRDFSARESGERESGGQESAPRESGSRESGYRESGSREESGSQESSSHGARESAPQRESQERHQEEQRPREAASASAGSENAPSPARHFDPAPPASSEGSGQQGQQRPYVVWSSAPGTGSGTRRDE